MKKQFNALVLGCGLALAASAAHATPIVGTFTGSAADQGLDLEGDFTYALTVNPFADGIRVGDARFTDAASTAGVVLDHQSMNQSWYNATYTGSAADLALGQVMNSVVWSYANGGVSMVLSMGGLTVGNDYKVQLLFGESCCSRGFDIWQDGQELVSDFSPSALAGIGNGVRSAFVGNTFTATSTSVIFGFGGEAPLATTIRS
jgi:hypothetical protein